MLTVILIASTVVLYFLTGFISTFKRKYGILKLKPFDCDLCLSFWLGVAVAIYQGVNFENFILICTVPPIIVKVLWNHLRLW